MPAPVDLSPQRGHGHKRRRGYWPGGVRHGHGVAKGRLGKSFSLPHQQAQVPLKGATRGDLGAESVEGLVFSPNVQIGEEQVLGEERCDSPSGSPCPLEQAPYVSGLGVVQEEAHLANGHRQLDAERHSGKDVVNPSEVDV